MPQPRPIGAGYIALLSVLGVASIVAGRCATQVSERRTPDAGAHAPEFVRKKWAPIPMTYCPGSQCTVEKKARRDCERRPGGVFSVEPDFVCGLDDGVHRMVCDDVDDEYQCGMMSHSDIAYARHELERYWDRYRHVLVDIDFHADFLENKFRCVERARGLSCAFTARSTGREHPDSPIDCNWMGCGFPEAQSSD